MTVVTLVTVLTKKLFTPKNLNLHKTFYVTIVTDVTVVTVVTVVIVLSSITQPLHKKIMQPLH